MPYKDLREFIETLEAKEQLKRVKKEVDWNLELSHVAKINETRGRGEALLFENVKDYPGKRVAINLVNTREKVALALGLDPTSRYLDMAQHWAAVTKEKIPPEWVDWCLWKENTITGDDVDLYDLPTPLFNLKDGGRYLGTAHQLINKNLKTGRLNLGTYRGMILGKNRLGQNLQIGKDAEVDLRDYTKANIPMPVALTIGVDPVLFICSAGVFPPDMSEYDIAGGLRGEPVPVTRGELVDLPIPATAEIVLEGEFLPGDCEWEGPFGEYTGLYGQQAHPQPVMTVKAIHYRNDPILWASLAGMPVTDTHVLQTVARTAGIWTELQNMGIPGIKAMYLPPMAGGRMIAIVSIEQLYPGHSTQVGLAIFTTTPGNYGLKMVVVVDSDIDPENWDQVIYALGFRYQPDRGTQIIQRGRATPLDPSIPKGERLFTSRVLIDACYPWEWKEKPVTVVLDEETRNKVEARWDEYLAP
jgi:phenylphosphate carboxylase beta subunit